MSFEPELSPNMPSTQPFVSVVTPFYNTALYIAQCIESVLAQRYPRFEYILLNNCSDDGSREIAAPYAARDARIRLLDNREFLHQHHNFNRALSEISPHSKYVKMVLADDALLPGCLAQMVEVAESNASIGLVAAYYVNGDHVAGSGLPLAVTHAAGQDAVRLMFRTRAHLVGTPSTVLYRADIVRGREAFFGVGRLHPDTEAAYEILLEHDLGFAHQVLSFVRTDNMSLTTWKHGLFPNLLDRLLTLERYGRRVLDPEEYAALHARAEREYFDMLGRMVLRFRGKKFWNYHRGGLASIERELRLRDLLPGAVTDLLHCAFNPGETLGKLASKLRTRAVA